MSGPRRFPSLVEESPSLTAHPNPPSGCRLNPTIIKESPTQIEEDECDQWFPLALGQGNNDEEEENGVLECHELHHSPLSVASSPAQPEPMSGRGHPPMLVEESPAPHHIMVEDTRASQCIVVEESPVPVSGFKNRPCNLVSAPKTTSPMEDRQPRVLRNWGGDTEVAMGSEPVFASHLRVQSPVVVHQSPQYIVVDESPSPPSQPNTVGPVSPPPSPRPRQATYIERVHGIPHLIRPSRGGGTGGGGMPLVGGRVRLLLRAPRTRLALRGGPLVPQWQGGLLAEAVVGHLLLVGGGSLVSTFWEPCSNTRGGRTKAHLWVSPVCGAL